MAASRNGAQRPTSPPDTPSACSFLPCADGPDALCSGKGGCSLSSPPSRLQPHNASAREDATCWCERGYGGNNGGCGELLFSPCNATACSGHGRCDDHSAACRCRDGSRSTRGKPNAMLRARSKASSPTSGPPTLLSIAPLANAPLEEASPTTASSHRT